MYISPPYCTRPDLTAQGILSFIVILTEKQVPPTLSFSPCPWLMPHLPVVRPLTCHSTLYYSTTTITTTNNDNNTLAYNTRPCTPSDPFASRSRQLVLYCDLYTFIGWANNYLNVLHFNNHLRQRATLEMGRGKSSMFNDFLKLRLLE